MLSDRDRRVIQGPMPRTADAFRLLVWSVKEYAIFMLDPNGVIVSWNEGAERIKGYREDEIIGEHFSIFYEQREIDSGKPDWELLVAEREGQFEDEGWRLRKDGSRFWASVTITALRDESGALRGFGKVTRDITDRKLAAERQNEQQGREVEKLREHANRLVQLEQTKSEFLNVASHELRGPLAVLRGYLSMVEDGTLSPDELPTVMPVMSGKLQQMELLVQRMLETARLEASRFELKTELLDVVALVDQMVARYRVFVQDTHALTLSRPETQAVVRGDPRRLETVLSNLLDNAVKYSPSGGPVACMVAMTRGRVFISVEDHGLGIAEEAIGRLFTRFGRIVTSENAHIDGTGLGLYLAREIARHHGGDILVESREGYGSRFTLMLPLSTERR